MVTENKVEMPAPSTAVHVNLMPAVSVETVTGSQPVVRSELIPEIGSVRVQLSATLVLFHPAEFGAGATVGTIAGGLVSILTVTEAEAAAPWVFVAVQVNVVPLVSADSVDVPQPVLVAIPVGSVSFQLTVTGTLEFQPEVPGAGFRVGAITGGTAFVFELVTAS
jgi:hypothetical protein